MSSQHSTRTSRQEGPPSQTRLQPQTRRNSAYERSLRRKKIFWLCILCWIMVLCLTAIIIIAVVHFQNSNSEIDQISAGALIGFGVLLIFVLAWSIIIYAKFSSSKAKRGAQQYRPSREEFVAFASSEVLGRGVNSTISTMNSSENSRSTERSAEGDTRRFVYRQRHHDGERRATATQLSVSPVSSSTRMTPEYHERGPGVGRPQVTHLPERHRAETDPPPRAFADTSSRAARRHSAPLPPPYLPPMSPPYRISESLPTGVIGTPPPAYDRVCGRSRRLESTTSEDSCLNPPPYHSRPPSPSPGSSAAGPIESGTQLTVPSHRLGMGIDHPDSVIPPSGRVRRYDIASSQPPQASPFPSPGVVLRENAIYYNSPRSRPSSASFTRAQTPIITATRYTAPYYRSNPAPRYHTSPHMPSSTSHSAFVLPQNAPESPTRPVSPPYSTNQPPPSRPVLSLSPPENPSRLSLVSNRPPSPIQETSEDVQEESSCITNETTTATTTNDTRRPNVVLVYLSQSADEEMIV